MSYGVNVPQLILRPVLSNDAIDTEIKPLVGPCRGLLSDFCDASVYYVRGAKYVDVRRICYVCLFSLHYFSLVRPATTEWALLLYVWK